MKKYYKVASVIVAVVTLAGAMAWMAVAADPPPTPAERAAAEHEAAARAEKEKSLRASSDAIVTHVRARYPIRCDAGETRLNIGGRERAFWMRCKGVLSDNGRVDVLVVTESKEVLSGFTGHAELTFKDEKGNVVWYVDTPSWGVNGTGIPSAPSRREEPVHTTIPPEVVVLTHSVEVAFLRRTNGDIGKQVTENLDRVHKFIDDNKASWEMVVALIGAAS